MRSHHRVLVFLFQGDKLVKEAEELVYLRLGKLRVVAGVLDFERVDVLLFPADYVGQRAEAWVANGNPYRVATVLLEQLDEYALAVKASFAPAPERDLVDFLHRSKNTLNSS